ncbi:MAG: phosphotyrosine protein phosphatase [Eubacterium sp.]|nr:phosphotyrosine protein phosphatase [Eubacterium sp.]
MAAAILKNLGLTWNIEILARGLVVLFPEPLNQKAEAVMISNGLSTEGCMSSQLTEDDLQGNVLVLAMESKHRDKILELFAHADSNKVHVLSEYVGDEIEVMDPYGGTLQMYGLCYETLLATLKKLVNILDKGVFYE